MKTGFHINDEYVQIKFNENLKNLIKNKKYNSVVILGIGSDRSTGDCLGALVGYKIEHIRQNKLHIYGTLENPVHARNLEKNINTIKEDHPNSLIIAIDASLGELEDIGYIYIKEEPIKPGSGVGKNLPEVGDISITGVVNTSGYMDFVMLQNTRLSLVMKMADIISEGLKRTLAII